jgi:hypothetical protein
VSVSLAPTILADHVRIECVGDFALDAFSEAFERVFALAAEADRGAVLVDVRKVVGEPTMAERYTLAVRVAELQSASLPRIRLAVLGHEPLIHPERFGEIVATNRGAVARAFTDEALALDWLLGRKARL